MMCGFAGCIVEAFSVPTFFTSPRLQKSGGLCGFPFGGLWGRSDPVESSRALATPGHPSAVSTSWSCIASLKHLSACVDDNTCKLLLLIFLHYPVESSALRVKLSKQERMAFLLQLQFLPISVAWPSPVQRKFSQHWLFLMLMLGQWIQVIVDELPSVYCSLYLQKYYILLTFKTSKIQNKTGSGNWRQSCNSKLFSDVVLPFRREWY